MLFQSAPPRGRRPSRSFTPPSSRRFNPRLHAGGDRARSPGRGSRAGFNPRLHAGGDLIVDVSANARAPKFQSAPPRGRRLRSACGVARGLRVSIRASTREATWMFSRGFWRCAVFQSAPPRGRRRGVDAETVEGLVFQSAPPRGRRPGRVGRVRVSGAVSIRASTREATRGVTGFRGEGGGAVSIRASTREATWPGISHRHATGVSIRASTREATGS